MCVARAAYTSSTRRNAGSKPARAETQATDISKAAPGSGAAFFVGGAGQAVGEAVRSRRRRRKLPLKQRPARTPGEAAWLSMARPCSRRSAPLRLWTQPVGGVQPTELRHMPITALRSFQTCAAWKLFVQTSKQAGASQMSRGVRGKTGMVSCFRLRVVERRQPEVSRFCGCLVPRGRCCPGARGRACSWILLREIVWMERAMARLGPVAAFWGAACGEASGRCACARGERAFGLWSGPPGVATGQPIA